MDCWRATNRVAVTVRFTILYVLVVMEIGSRRIIHSNVTEHPTADWTLRQFRETQVQYHRKPDRCQPTTVLGVTTMRGAFHPGQSLWRTTQNSLCGTGSRRRGWRVCKAIR